MKTFYPLLILAICQICKLDSSAQMRQLSQDVNDGMNEVQELSFFTSSEGYVAFSKYIGFTSDSGRTFTRKYITHTNVNFNNYPVNLTFGFSIKGMKALNQDTIIVYGDYGLVPSILYSTDKGNSFTLVYHDRYDVFALKSGITGISFSPDHSVGYAVEADYILKTTNKGRTWTPIKLDVDRYYDGVQVLDNNNVYAYSTEHTKQKVIKSTNGGSSWTDVTFPSGYITYVQFLTNTKGWVALSDNSQRRLLYYTSNGGATWEQKNDPDITPFPGFKFRFINDNTGFALGRLYDVYKTTDSGRIWELLPRDNDFTYLGYSHNDLQIFSADQLWVGGGHGFIEINTNATSAPLPAAFFKVDIDGIATDGTVKLINYSRPNYQFKWFKNDTLIGTSYHASFVHNQYQFRDSVKLVVSNGTQTDTLVKYIDYPKVWITSFTPVSASRGDVVTINGYNLGNTLAVYFGGQQASAFKVVSSTQVRATVNYGATGNVEVFTTDGSASKSGFTFLGNPRFDLPSRINDSLLCKSEPVTVTIDNSEPGVIYQFYNWTSGYLIGNSIEGNGGTVGFVTAPISASGEYRVVARRVNTTINFFFIKSFNIVVERPRARFVANQVNITPGEAVDFAAQAGGTRDYQWTFQQDASIVTATGSKVPGITYGSIGQKTLQLIATSADGCRDTTTANAVFVYSSPSIDPNCFVNPLDSTGQLGMGIGPVISSDDDGFYVIGATGNATKLRSMAGIAKEFAPNNHSFFAKYSAGGVLKWLHYFKPGGGVFAASATDAVGNIYLTGYALSTQWLYFNNGDSMRFAAAPVDTIAFMGGRISGFVLKLDRNGKLIWYTMLYDPTQLGQGVAADAHGERIAVKDDHIVVIGGFYSKLSYARNGVMETLYDNVPTARRVHDNHAIVKIRPDGSLIWTAHLRFQANNWHSLSDISLDKQGNSYLAGTYEYRLGVHDASGAERLVLTGQTGYHKGFMVKIDATGAVGWHNDFSSISQYGDASINKVSADDEGNTYVGGTVAGQALNVTHSDGTVSSDSLAALLLYKFAPNGKRVWAVGCPNSVHGGVSAVYVKGSDVYVFAQLANLREEPQTFDLTSSDGNNRKLSLNANEGFVARYDTAGVYKRAFTSGMNFPTYEAAITALYIDSKGRLILAANAGRSRGAQKFFGAEWPHFIRSYSDGVFARFNADFCQSGVAADAGPDKTGCAGMPVSIGTNASGDYYSWTSSPAGFTSFLPNPSPGPLVTTTYYLKVTNDIGAAAFDTVTVTIQPKPIVDAGRDTTICSGQGAFIGTPAIDGYQYAWFLVPFTQPFSTGSAVTAVNTQSTASFALRATGPNGCIAFDTVTVYTIGNGFPLVYINGPRSGICKGDPVTYTAVTENVGEIVSYKWMIHGRTMVGATGKTYTTDSLKNNDQLGVEITHKNSCIPLPQLNAYTGSVQVLDKINPSVTITGNTVVNKDDMSEITANVSNAGANYRMEWQDSTSTHNWQVMQAQSTNVVFYNPAATGDKIRCVLRVGSACAAAATVTSAALRFTVNTITAIEPVPAGQYGLRLYPNPVQKTLIIDSLRLIDHWQQLQINSLDGSISLAPIDISNRTRKDINVEGLRPGMYVAILRNRNGVAVYLKFIKL